MYKFLAYIRDLLLLLLLDLVFLLFFFIWMYHMYVMCTHVLSKGQQSSATRFLHMFWPNFMEIKAASRPFGRMARKGINHFPVWTHFSTLIRAIFKGKFGYAILLVSVSLVHLARVGLARSGAKVASILPKGRVFGSLPTKFVFGHKGATSGIANWCNFW